MNQLSFGTAEGKTRNQPSSRIFRIENHDEALSVWRNSAVAGRILVHVDAHHDMWWVPPGRLITIANFISPALRDGLLREIYWVVPDRSWESAENRRQILHTLYRIQRGFPGRSGPLEIQRGHISTRLLGKQLNICSVEGLPKFGEEVLLDLDVDYLIFPRVTYGPGDPHPPRPWIWPEDLLRRLNAREVRPDLVTIAYSVHGGYTPLRWKYMGDELEARLGGAGSCVVRGLERMREASDAAALGEFGIAERKLLEAAECLPDLAAPLWHLAYLYLDCGRVSEGQSMYHRATRLDASYRTPFNSNGLWEYWDRRWKGAEREYRRTLALDPLDPHAHLGLGWLALERKDWKEAESELQKAIEYRPDLLDAHRALGCIFQRLGRPKEAIVSYEKSLKLSLLGQEPLRVSQTITADRLPWNDLTHFVVYLKLGYLFQGMKELTRARQYLRMAAAGGQDGTGVRFRLASIAFQQREWKLTLIEVRFSLKQSAVWAIRQAKKLWRTLRRPLERAYESWRVQ